MNHHASPQAQIRDTDTVGEIRPPTVEPHRGSVSQYDTVCRVIHAFLSLIGLILLSPVFLSISFLIKLTSHGPVLYRGRRVGRDGQIFTIYKFRTLVEGAEEKIGARLLRHDDIHVYYTRIGRFLKRTKLDELPQLFNVIRGEMRLVGPRPIRPIFLKKSQQEIPNYSSRFVVPPGITGIAQLRGGYYTHPRYKLRYDLIYIKSRSLFLDFKLVLLTFVKILNRWLSTGFFMVFLFVIVSFIPKDLQPSFDLSFFDIKINLVYLFIVLVAASIFFKNGPRQFAFYRCPLNLPIFLFICLSLLSALVSPNPYLALQGFSYYVVSGFLVALIIVNNLATKGFIALMVRAIALTSVAISLLGLFQIFMLNYNLAIASYSSIPSEKLLQDYIRLSSTPGGPVVLSVYLVLGIPLLLSEVTRAQSQRERDFWLVCTTISFVGILFTQTRVGLLALMVTSTVFLSRRLRHAILFLAGFLVCFLVLVSLGLPRFSLPRIHSEVTEWIEEKTPLIRAIPANQWLIGVGAMAREDLIAESGQQKSPEAEQRKAISIQNMHVTWMVEHGIPGWILLMWIVFSALWAMKQAHDRTRDSDLRIILWAIISSVIGFLISMNGMNTFHNLTIQIFFWSLIGIGLGIVIHLNGPRRYNLIWRFGDADD